MNSPSPLTPEGLKALRDFAVGSFDPRFDEHAEKPWATARIAGAGMAEAAIRSYLPFLGDTLGWYDTFGGADYSDPYVDAPMHLEGFIDALRDLELPSDKLLASSMSVSPDGTHGSTVAIEAGDGEEWKEECRRRCSQGEGEGYESFLLFNPNNGRFWLVSNYEVDPQEVEGGPDPSHLPDTFREIFPGSSDEENSGRYFAPEP